MTIKDVFQLRKDGLIEEAYAAVRPLYARDKGPYTSLAMFWTAVDMLRIRLSEGRREEAEKIFLAIERMLPNVPDREGWVKKAFEKCQTLIQTGETRDRLRNEGPQHLQTGIWGEELAVAYLRENGYVVLERDWHSGHRDIDIVARKDGLMVFIEVKTRRSRSFGDPALAVDKEKQLNLLHAINHYMNYRHVDIPYRFDVITIVGTPDCAHPEIEHIKDFQLEVPRFSGGRRW